MIVDRRSRLQIFPNPETEAWLTDHALIFGANTNSLFTLARLVGHCLAWYVLLRY